NRTTQAMAPRESREPKSIEPVAPVKIEAGLELCHKKPSSAPAKHKENIAIGHWPAYKNAAPKKSEAMVPMPPASPSIPSIRLTALITTMTVKKVIGRAIQTGISAKPKTP